MGIDEPKRVLVDAKKVIKVNVEGAATIPYKELEPFQGDLKRLEKSEYERLRGLILEHGFSFVIHVWEHKDHNYVLDGHQRLYTVKQLVEVEGYKTPPLPVAFVKAKSYAEAKRKLLAAASQYGKVTQESLAAFAKENDIPFDEIVANFNFPEIDFSAMAEDFAVSAHDQAPDLEAMAPPPENQDPKLKSASDQVRQLQLFFTSESYSEFIRMMEDLQAVHNKANVTDTILEVVREAHKARLASK